MREWDQCLGKDLWIYDKLILATRLGYHCGPHGTDVPIPGSYIVRPCVNLLGMGRKTRRVYIEERTDHLLNEGEFWCQEFKGEHLSVDYFMGSAELVVRGKREPASFSKWKSWEKATWAPPLPVLLQPIIQNYQRVNVEFIGGKVIEMHLRSNPDFIGHDADIVYPVYKEEDKDHTFIHAPESERLGFNLGWKNGRKEGSQRSL